MSQSTSNYFAVNSHIWGVGDPLGIQSLISILQKTLIHLEELLKLSAEVQKIGLWVMINIWFLA